MADPKITITAGLDIPKSVAQINAEIQKIKGQVQKLQLQVSIDGKSNAEIQKQITALNKQKRQLYIDLKLRQKDLKNQYKQAIAQTQAQAQPLNVDVNTSNAQKQMTGLNNSVQTTRSETETLGNSITKTLNNMGLVISAQTALQTIRRAAQEATEAVKEYDKYAKNLKIITNKNDVSDLMADISGRSLDMKVDVSEYEAASEVILRAGKNIEESAKYTETAIKLAKTGFIDASDSANNLVTIANAYDITADKLENVSDVLLTLDSRTNTTAGSLSEAMSKSAKNAQLAGLSYQELASIIAKLRDTTGKTESELSTSLNQILNRAYRVKLNNYIIENEDGTTEDITQQLNDVEKMLDTVGVSIRNSKGEFKDFSDIVSSIVPVFDELSDVAQNSIAYVLGGSQHKNVVLNLIDDWKEIQSLTDTVENSIGATDTKYNAYLESIESKSAALSTALKDLWNNLIPNGLVGDITEATTGLVQFVDEYQVLQTVIKSATFYALAKGIIASKNSLLGMVTDIKNVSYAMNLATQSTAMTREQFKSFAMVLGGLSDTQLKLILSNSKLSESEMIKALKINGVTEAEAKQRLATLGLAQANTTATGATFSLTGSMKALFATISANPVMALTLAFTALVTIYQTVQRKQEEARQEIKDTADKAKELTDNINSLYQAYTDMQIGVENGTESKENLTTATNDLLKALGYEGEAVDKLIEKYGTLDNAINQATADKLKNSLPDLASAVNVELGELKEEALGHDQLFHWGFYLTADDPESRELLNFIKEYDKKNGGVDFEIINTLTTRIDFEGDKSSAEGIKERLDNMQALRQALFDEYGVENVQSLDIYDDLCSRITELETAYNEYNTALSNYNDTAAQAQIIQSLIGNEIPKTVDEYKAYRQELIRTAQNSGQFIGSQEDITNAIDGTLSKMNEFADIRERVNNLDTAYNLLGVDDNVNSASEGMKKAFINSLDDTDLSILIQLDKSIFDKDIEAIKQAIKDFNNNPDKPLEAETDTTSLDELQKAYEETTKSADSFIKNQKSLKSALEEQEKHGQLSASTIRELSEAGYSEALVTDTVTGAVTLNTTAYDKLNEQKKEKIRLDLLNEKNSLEDKLKDEQTAVSDLRQEYEALAKADMEANTGRLSEITLELAKRGANIDDISALISQINGDITSLDAPTFDSDNTDPNKEAFDKLYSKWNHDLEMHRVTQEEYINWLDGAYKQYFSDLTKYEDEYNKYEEEVYKARLDREQDLFDKKIENYMKLSDNALDKYVDSDGNELTVNASFDYARSQINSAIAETQNRINALSLKTGFEDEIEELTSDLEDLYDTLDDINKKEIESQKEYISNLKDEYSDLMDEQIDRQKKLADSINESYESQIDTIDKQIDAINKVNEAEERQKKILEAQKAVKEAQKELDEASIKNRIVITSNGWQARADDTAVKEAKENLANAKEDLEKAYQDEQIAKLEEQKELLETQRDNSKDYYDKVVEDLENQKTDREKQYDILVDIYEQLGGEKKQTTFNDSLVDKLTKNGDINKAVQGLTPTELQKAFTSGLLTTDSNGNYTIDYSILDNNSEAVKDNTDALNGVTDALNQFVPKTEETTDGTITAGGFNLVADENGKLTKQSVKINGEVVEGLGQKVKPVTKSEWEKDKLLNNVGKFAGFDTMQNLIFAIKNGEYKLPASWGFANQTMNGSLRNGIGKDITKVPDYVNSSFNNAPIVNVYNEIQGDATNDTVKKITEGCKQTVQTEIKNVLSEMTTKIRTMPYKK